MRRNRVVYLMLILCFIIIGMGHSFSYAKSDLVDYKSIDVQIAEDVKKYHIPGMAIMVVDKDDILFSNTYGNCKDIDTPFIIGSMSKSFVAIAIMQLVEDGKINLDDSISEYIDAAEWFVQDSDCEKITVRNLLNQTSGITTYQRFGKLEVTDSYGQHVYANTNYGLLGLIIESVSGRSYEEYITENIFEPLGMEHSAATLEKSKANGLIAGYRNYFGIPIAGEPDYPQDISIGTWTSVSAGYLSSSASDMGKYLQMYLNGGNDILGEDSIGAMFYDSVSVDDDAYFYGMGWQYSTEMFSQPVLWHSGLVENYTSNMFILPEKGIGIIVLVNMNDYLVGNNLLGNVVLPLMGEEKNIFPVNIYVFLHLVIDLVCLLICIVTIYPLMTIKKWKDKKGVFYVVDIVRHLILPIVLLCVPIFLSTPVWVIWLFAKDICIVLYANAILLMAVGIYKLVYKFCKGLFT